MGALAASRNMLISINVTMISMSVYPFLLFILFLLRSRIENNKNYI